MSLPVPLTVRLSTSRGDVHITRRLRDLTIRSVAPGGFASIAMSFDVPLTDMPDEIAYYGKAYVYDARTGATVCEGRLEDPGRSAGQDGQVWDLVAVGPAAHAKDRNVPLIYVDRSIESSAWVQTETATTMPKGDVTAGSPGTDAAVAALKLAWDSGLSIPVDSRIAAQYVRLRDSGQWVARVGADHVEGAPSTVLKVQYVNRHSADYPGTDTVLESDNWTTSTAAILQQIGVGSMDKHAAPELRLLQTNATPVTSGSNYWTSLSNLYVVGSRVDKAGSDVMSGYGATALASDVVADLLGRLLPQYDGAGARIDTTSYGIDQLAYPDGIDPAGVLDDLMALEPGYLWEALESNPAGKHRFNWRAWPASVRYEADVTDGYASTGSATDLYNAATVRYRTPNGQIRSVRVTQSVPELTNAGLTREPKPLDLGDNVGSAAAATQYGQAFLAEHGAPRNAGRLTVVRPILDLDAGAMVMPWEIRPGYLIRVRGILPRVDALNASARDGVTVFRIVSSEYRVSSAAATLELDSWAVSTARSLATLLGRAETRRR
ncbi:hypothetical protein [Micromonospora sp. RTP1Z1]|uniref:hypothetical protein n=1 Tax=Micromonospora sp. RTP1Z1 TaxID=2994043 RepID=UPI0029C5FD68|nr:hypothetical protein [Micromonospora sp. RTP1Z1]